MAQSTSPPRRSRSAQLFSTLLFVAAIGFAAAAIWIWYTDDSSTGPGTPPPADTVDEVDLAQVLGVLKDQSDDWTYSRNPTGASTDQIGAPGQALTHNDDLLFVFIFTGANAEEKVAAREAASEQLALDSMVLTTPSGNVVNADDESLYMAEHSNVITILVGGDEALNTEIQEALDELP